MVTFVSLCVCTNESSSATLRVVGIVYYITFYSILLTHTQSDR